MGQFHCPIFDTTTDTRACGKLQTLVWRGERPEVRRGCQACMDSGKCPFIVMGNLTRKGEVQMSELYTEGGKIRADILERIAPVIIQERHIGANMVPAAEQLRMEGANERIRKAIGAAPKTIRARSEPATKRSAPKPPVKSEPINVAAATGDMSAAINQAA